MINTALLCSFSTVTDEYTSLLWRHPSVTYTDSKCDVDKLKSSRAYLIGYSGFISCKWFFIAWGQTHKHTLMRQSILIYITHFVCNMWSHRIFIVMSRASRFQRMGNILENVLSSVQISVERFCFLISPQRMLE